jgi:hypothetical protein
MVYRWVKANEMPHKKEILLIKKTVEVLISTVSQPSWIRSQFPLTQWNLRGADEAVLNKVHKKLISLFFSSLDFYFCQKSAYLLCLLESLCHLLLLLLPLRVLRRNLVRHPLVILV